MTQEQIDIFENYLLDAVRQTLPQRAWTPVAQGFAHGITQTLRQSNLGFLSPQLKGQIQLQVSQALLEETCPGFAEAGDQASLFLDDWVGELSNLILGRLKAQLLPHGIDLKLIISSGSASQQDAPDEIYWERKTTLVHQADLVTLIYRVHFDPTLDLSCQVPVSPHSLQPGNAVFRLAETADHKNRYDMVYKVRSGVDAVPEEDTDDIFEDEYQRPVKPYVPSGPAVNPVRQSQRLTGLDWKEEDALILTFYGQRSYELDPLALLKSQPSAQLEIESLRVELRREGASITICIPELHINMKRQKASA